MVCEVPRTYIPQPDLSGSDSITIPLNITDPEVLRNVLQQIVNALNNPADPVPGQVTGFTATSFTGGIRLRWDGDPKAFAYVIFRNNISDLSSARTITDNYSGSFGLQEWMDKVGQDTSLAARYYWIAGYNKSRVLGPVFGPVKSAEPA